MDPVLTPMIGTALVSAGAIETAGATFTFLGAEIGIASAISTVVVTGSAIGASIALQAAQKKPKSEAGQQTIRQSVGPRTRGYGQDKMGGTTVFFYTDGVSLFHGIVHTSGPIDSFQQWWLNDKNSGIAAGSLGGPSVAAPWGSNVTIESRTGTDAQTALSLLTGAGGGWTTNHRLNGLACSAIKYGLPLKPEKNFQKVYPSGVPGLRVVARLSRLFDPRNVAHDIADSSTWSWSDNSALAILDYLKHPDGYAIPAALLDFDSFADFADVCDEGVSLVAGGTEPRYRAWGTYALTDEPRGVLKALLDTCDGELVQRPDGTIGIRGGAWTEPEITITSDMILGYEWQAENDKLAAFNKLKITFRDPLNDYQQVEAEAWEDEDDQAVQGVLSQDLPLPFVPSPSQARRLAKIFMAKGTPEHQLVLTTNAGGLRAIDQRIIRVTIDELEIDRAFFVSKFTASGDLSTCQIAVSSLDASAYAWNPTGEEGTAPSVGTVTEASVSAPAPTGIAVVLQRTSLDLTVRTVKAVATADAPTDALAAYWTLIGQYRAQGSSVWAPMNPDPEGSVTKVITDILTDGATYEIQVAYAGLGMESAWSATQTITAVADTNPPAAATSVTASIPGGSIVYVQWTNPSSANYYAGRVYRNTTNNPSTATLLGSKTGLPGATSLVDFTSPSGTYYFWVAAINGSGVEAAKIASTPASLTVP